MQGDIAVSGSIGVKVLRAQRAPLEWRLRNTLRRGYLWGMLCNWLARLFTGLTEIPTITADLGIRVRKASGQWIDYGIVSFRVVTDTGVAYLVDDWDGGSGGADMSLFNYHGAGTGSTAEAAGQTALVTESTTALNPDNTRATGTTSQPAANQFRTVGTLTFDASATIAEHGLFTVATVGSGTMWDRSQFTGIPLASGDSIQFTYTGTVNSGG